MHLGLSVFGSLFDVVKNWFQATTGPCFPFLGKHGGLPVSGRSQLRFELLETRDLPSAATLLDWNLSSGGGEFRLKLRDQQISLEKVGGSVLYQADANNTTIHIAGTAAADLVHLDFDQADAAKGLEIFLDLAGGADQAQINLAAGAETVQLSPESALVQASIPAAKSSLPPISRYLLHVSDAETIRVVSNGGADTLQMNDGPGDDAVEATPDHVSMTRAGYLNYAQGFPKVKVNATASELNHAVLQGSAVNDAADCAGLKVTLKSADKKFDIELNGFTRVTLDCDTGGGADQIILRDSIRSDELVFHPNTGVLTRGDGIQYSFRGFEKMWFGGNSGKKLDTDVVRLFDTAGSETFRASRNWGIYIDDKNSWDLRVFNIDTVYVDGSQGGFDVLSGNHATFAVKNTGFKSAKDYRLPALGPLDALWYIKKLALQMNPALATATSPMDLAIKLRDWVHQRTILGSNTVAWQYQDAYSRFYTAMVTRQEAVLCQGKAWLYQSLLLAFGIPAREVGLYSPTFRPNHSSIEVFIDKRWIVMDPSFDVAFTDSAGKYLSYAQMRALPTWTVQHNGTVNRAVYTLNTFYPYRAYLYQIVYPSTHFL